MIEIKEWDGEGYQPLIWSGGWRAAFLNDTPKFHPENIHEMQRHRTSDEVFLLIEGECTLYAAGDREDGPGAVEAVRLERGKMYSIRRGVWHTHALGPGSKVAVIENAEVSPENTDYMAAEVR